MEAIIVEGKVRNIDGYNSPMSFWRLFPNWIEVQKFYNAMCQKHGDNFCEYTATLRDIENFNTYDWLLND